MLLLHVFVSLNPVLRTTNQLIISKGGRHLFFCPYLPMFAHIFKTNFSKIVGLWAPKTSFCPYLPIWAKRNFLKFWNFGHRKFHFAHVCPYLPMFAQFAHMGKPKIRWDYGQWAKKKVTTPPIKLSSFKTRKVKKHGHSCEVPLNSQLILGERREGRMVNDTAVRQGEGKHMP